MAIHFHAKDAMNDVEAVVVDTGVLPMVRQGAGIGFRSRQRVTKEHAQPALGLSVSFPRAEHDCEFDRIC